MTGRGVVRPRGAGVPGMQAATTRGVR